MGFSLLDLVLGVIGVIEQNLEFLEEFQQFINPQKFATLSTGNMFNTAAPAHCGSGSLQPKVEHKCGGR
jgi:hypothetical protein